MRLYIVAKINIIRALQGRKRSFELHSGWSFLWDLRVEHGFGAIDLLPQQDFL